jgi:hypothetical protein
LRKKVFKVTEEHIKLLRQAYVDWDDCEFGAPAIDCKRPYGNSDVVGDVAEILGRDDDLYLDEGDWERDEELVSYLSQIHRETLEALQIFLATGKMEVGTYELNGYGNDWVKVTDES